MTSIYLVRHAESEMNLLANNVVMGRSNETPLTRRGQEQAHMLGRFIGKHLPPIHMVHTSPARRARHTLDIALSQQDLWANPVVDPDLQEISQGMAEGRNRRLVWTEDAVRQLEADPWNFRQPGGESVNDGAERMLGYLLRTTESFPNKTILSVTHGFAIRSLAGKIAGWTHEQVVDGSQTPNASVSLFTVEHNKPGVEYVGLPTDS